MRLFLVIAAVAASTALHFGLAAWFLPEQTKVELAGGDQQPAVFVMGKDEFDALANGEPELQEQPLEDVSAEAIESTPQPEEIETLEVVEDLSSVQPDTQPTAAKNDRPVAETLETEGDVVAALSEPIADEKQKLQASTPQTTAVQSVSKTEIRKAVEVQAQEIQVNQPEVLDKTNAESKDVQSKPVEKPQPAEQPKAANEITVEAVKPPLEPTEQPASIEQQIETLDAPIAEPVENKISHSVAETDLNALNVPVPTPRPEAITKPIKKAEAKPPVRKKKTTKKPAAKKKQSKKKVAKKTNKQQKKSKLAKAGAKSKSNTNAKRGSAAVKPSKKKKQGNAKASKYPGRVFAKIARTRRKRAGGSGTARIRFVISAKGKLLSVSLARGSGNKKVDRAALDHVRRAAPFPKPPVGAKRNFVIPLKFKN